MKKRADIETVNLIWISILLPIVSILSSLGISYLFDNYGIVFTLILLLSILLGVFILSILVVLIVKTTHRSRIDLLLDASRNQAFITAFRDIDIGVAGLKGIYPEQEIAQMELTNHFEEIWLVSHDMLTEIEDGAYSGVVQQNLRRGVKYVYFVPNMPIVNHRIEILRDRCNNSKNLKFFYLDDDFFFLVPQIDFAIYEPRKTIDEGKRGYMGINIEGLSGRFETLMNHSFLDAMVAKLDSIQRLAE